jgi:hypothetical protein
MPRRASKFSDSSGPGLELCTSFRSTGNGSYSHFLLCSTLERALALLQLRRLMDDPSPVRRSHLFAIPVATNSGRPLFAFGTGLRFLPGFDALPFPSFSLPLPDGGQPGCR